MPALRAAIAAALCMAVEHLAAPRHTSLLLHLSLMADLTVKGV
jgi:hypothetical protein